MKMLCLAALALVASHSAAYAATLAPGDSALLPGTTAAAEPDLAGAVIRDDTQPLRVTGGVPVGVDPDLFPTGFTVQDRVTRSNNTGNLIFGPRLRDSFNINPFAGNFLVDAVEVTGYAGFDVNANYRTDGAGVRGPTFAERSGDGDTLTFTFGFPLFVGNMMGLPQEDSYFFSIETDAEAFDESGTLTVFGRYQDAPGEVFSAQITGIAAPAIAPIPLPAAGLLLLAGLGALGLLRHKT